MPRSLSPIDRAISGRTAQMTAGERSLGLPVPEALGGGMGAEGLLGLLANGQLGAGQLLELLALLSGLGPGLGQAGPGPAAPALGGSPEVSPDIAAALGG
jgi:hypothetical protein